MLFYEWPLCMGNIGPVVTFYKYRLLPKCVDLLGLCNTASWTVIWHYARNETGYGHNTKIHLFIVTSLNL